jgi:anaerobic magnesium-protoporphyrin IX monomethyl ester cyclase
MKILLAISPSEGEVTTFSAPEFLKDFSVYPPLGLLAIATNVDPKHEIKILDCDAKNYGIQDVVDIAKEYKPDIFGISTVSRRIYSALTVSQKIREEFPEIVIIAGGPHINDFPIETIKLGAFDYALSGYAEKTFPRFVEILSDGKNVDSLLRQIPGLYLRNGKEIVFTYVNESPVLLDELPYPKRELVDLEDYFTLADNKQMTTMYTSRGCPYKCTFCDVQEKTYHFRSTKSIVDEMEYILSLGIDDIHIFDDTFNMGRKRVIDMCNEIIERGLNFSWSARVRAHPADTEMLALMKKAGCSRLQCGVESLLPISLKNMKKKITLDHINDFFAACQKLNISTLMYLILGFPEETPEYRNSISDGIKKLNPTYIQVTVLYPLPQTTFYNDLLEQKIYEKDHWADFFKKPIKDYNLPPCRPIELNQEYKKLALGIQKKFFFSPAFVLRELRRTLTLRLLLLKILGAFKLFVYQTKS